MSERRDQIDRLVDGELSLADQRELLCDCEARHSWREVALAFVEAQVLGAEMKHLSPEPRSATAAPTGEAPRGRNKEAARRKPSTAWPPWALAASVALSLGIGYGLGWWVDRTSAVLPGSTQVAQHAPPVPSEPTELNATPPANDADQPTSMQLTITDPGTNELKQIDLPIVHASALGPNWVRQLPRPVSDDFVNEMRGHGLDVTQRRMFLRVKTSGGQRVVVPVDYINLEQGFY